MNKLFNITDLHPSTVMAILARIYDAIDDGPGLYARSMCKAAIKEIDDLLAKEAEYFQDTNHKTEVILD